jgi:redox-sensitive bicupin YhaK (pirin superfamily)
VRGTVPESAAQWHDGNTVNRTALMLRESDLIIEPRLHDLGDGFVVRRVLPFRLRRQVGPFVFFDHFGPVDFAAGRGMDVRPHPHIGLATVTYLYDGAIRHRDSLGFDQAIRPGDVNWMTAGRGIVHSERTPPDERATGQRLHGVQTWLGLPLESQDVEPEFHHHDAATLPEDERGGVRLRVIAGTAFGMASPVRVYSPTLYVDARFAAGARIVLADEHAERAVYLIEGELSVGGEPLARERMHVLAPGEIELAAATPARALICGGAPLDGERIIWWNFVASSRSRIERAKADWVAQRFGQVPGATEFIPLPDS